MADTTAGFTDGNGRRLDRDPERSRGVIRLVAWPTDYMVRRPDINPKMRCILVDWLVSLCAICDLHCDTLHLGCFVMDRFLSMRSISRGQLQLVGAVCLWIASKVEEVEPVPLLERWTYWCDGAFTAQQFVAMETLVLRHLHFALGQHTMYPFALFAHWDDDERTNQATSSGRASRAQSCTQSRTHESIRQLTRYFFDASLLSYPLVHVHKVVVLAGCVLLSKLLFRRRRIPVLSAKYSECWKLHKFPPNWSPTSLVTPMQRVNS
jgi:hypothetical protein